MTGSKADSLIAQCKANFPTEFSFDTTGTMGLWLKMFGNIADDVMETAIRLCLLSCKKFPTVADIKGAINEINRDLSYQSKPHLEQPSAKWMSKAASKAAAIVREGKAKEFFDRLDYSDLHIFAKQYFPEIGIETVKENSNEIQYCMEENNRCLGCQWNDGNCHNSGFYPALVINKNGWISWEMKMCGKKASACGMNRRQSA